MKIELWFVGKTSKAYLKDGNAIFEKRIRRYINFKTHVIPDLKNTKTLRPAQIKHKEGEQILSKINPSDFLVLLDERGKSFSSLEFSKFINRQLQQTYPKIIFLIGGAFGFSEAIYQRANTKLSLSNLTFSHQMARLFFLEQLYRAFSILNNEPYHNE